MTRLDLGLLAAIVVLLGSLRNVTFHGVRSPTPDPEGTVNVWLVDGNLVRSYYKTDYTEGGHGYVYPWVPKPEIWIEDGADHREVPYIVCHEYIERRLMRDEGLD